MQIDAITLFPEMFDALCRYGVTRRALDKGIWNFKAWNPRDFTHDVHNTVDDRPYGGGPGMVMLIEPLAASIESAKERQKSQGVLQSKVIYLSPQGKTLTHAKAVELSRESGLIFLCGRYEGVDERLLQTMVDEELSIGDYVLSGGEMAAMVAMDALIRLIPGVLNDAQSHHEDSFVTGLLDCPHYTRPEVYHGMRVPDVLLSGHHAHISQWRLKQALGRTWQRRPDLLIGRTLTKQESRLLAQYQQEQESVQEQES